MNLFCSLWMNARAYNAHLIVSGRNAFNFFFLNMKKKPNSKSRFENQILFQWGVKSWEERREIFFRKNTFLSYISEASLSFKFFADVNSFPSKNKQSFFSSFKRIFFFALHTFHFPLCANDFFFFGYRIFKRNNGSWTKREDRRSHEVVGVFYLDLCINVIIEILTYM